MKIRSSAELVEIFLKLFKKRKSHDSVVLLAPSRANKAYPFGKGVGIFPPVLDLTTGEYWSDFDERKYLSSLGYEEIELKLFDYDHKLFFDYARLMYDKDIGRLMYLSKKERSELSFWDKLEITNIYDLLPKLKTAFEIIKKEVENE